MTLEQALAELGIDHDASAVDARRAYLRLLKVRKPEVDPQGFMRLREAYELAKGCLDARRMFFDHVGPIEPPAPDAARIPAAKPAAADEPPAPELPADLGEPARAPAPDDAAAPDPAPLARGRDEDEVAPVEAQAVDTPPVPAASWDELLALGRHADAAAALSRIFEGAVREVSGAMPPLYEALRLLVILHVEGALAPAAALHAAVASWLAASGQEARLLRAEAAARWHLLGELAALPTTFPGPVRAALARAMLGPDLGAARADLQAIREQSGVVARAAAGVLRSKAPLLARVGADVLDPPRVQARPAPAPPRSFKGGWALTALAIGLLRFLLVLGRGTSGAHSYDVPTAYSPSRHNGPGFDAGALAPILDTSAAFPAAPSHAMDLKGRVLHRAERTQAHAYYMLGVDAGKRRIDYEKVAADAEAVSKAVDKADCAAARAAIKRLRARAILDANGADVDGRVEVETLDRTLTAFCAEVASASAKTMEAGAAVADAGRCGGTESE